MWILSSASKISKALFFGVLAPLALVSVGVLAFIAMGSQQPKQAPKDGKDRAAKLLKLPIVSVEPVKSYEGIESLDVSLMGTVVPYRQITLAAEVAGRVKNKSEDCRIGRYVHKGDLLFELDATDFELEVERLQAMRDAEYAQQRELDQEIANLRKSMELAEEDVALQEKELKRLESLPSGFSSVTEVDQAKRLRLSAANQRLNIQNQLQLQETRRARLQLAEKLAEAQLQQSLVNLERTRVTAPIDGVIINELVQMDSYVQKGANLCLIEDTQQVEVSCNLRTDQLLLILDQQDAGKPREERSKNSPSSRVMQSASYELPKTPVTISYQVAGRDDLVFQWQGHLSRYEGIGLDAQSRTVPIRITVDNPRDVMQNGKKIDEEANGGLPALVRGMFVDVSIHTQPNRDLMLIPKLGLKPGNQVWSFMVDDAALGDPTPVNQEPSQKEFDNAKGSKPIIDPQEWSAGWIRVISSVNVISVIRTEEGEFWIAESRDDLKPGFLTVVSPMANIVGDGTDKARFKSKP